MNDFCVICGKDALTIDDLCSDCHMKAFWEGVEVDTIIHQDNAVMDKYVQALEAAQVELESAALDWQLSNSTGDSLIAADRLESAQSAYNKASSDLASHVASFWRNGYRLIR